MAWKFMLPNRISNPAGRGSELPMEYLWDLYSVRITIEMADGKLIFSVMPLPGAPTITPVFRRETKCISYVR
jgi:hypothetical protein